MLIILQVEMDELRKVLTQMLGNSMMIADFFRCFGCFGLLVGSIKEN